MSITQAELSRVLADLQSMIGHPLTGAWQSHRDRVTLGFPDTYLLIVPRGPLARLHTTPGRPRNPANPFSFQGACRAHLHGRLTAIVQVPNDRIVDLCFGPIRLHVRLTGRSGGLWLTRGNEVIAAYDGPAPKALPEVAPRPLRPEPIRFEPVDGSFHLGARRFFTDLERDQKTKQLRGELSRRIHTEMRRKHRLLEALEKDLDRARSAPTLRRQADALAARLHTLKKGSQVATVQDLEDPNHTWMISLEPSQPPVFTMEKLYKKARRLDRAGDVVMDRMILVEERLEHLNSAAATLPTADADELKRIEDLAPRKTSRRAPSAERKAWVVWGGPQGREVLVGRNAKGNSRLTFQVARGSDYWMHLRGRPAAHLILPAKKGHPPPLEHLLAAAQIALVHARVAEGDSADVQYTRVKNVRSVKGEADLVEVHGEKVLRVTRSRDALKGWSTDEWESE